MIVVVGGVKGGSGKTTIATNLAVLRSSDNKKVLLVDADEQKSTTCFANQRDALGIDTKWSTIQLSGETIHKQILRMQPDFDDIIVDVGGRDTRSQRSALAVADVYLIPFKPRSFDVWTLGDVKTIIRDMIVTNPNLKCFAFLNQADSKGSDNEDTFAILEDCTEIQSLDVSIGNRKTFGNSSSEGLGVIEVKNIDKKAIMEIMELYHSIYN